LTLLYLRTHACDPLPCLTCGATVNDPGHRLLVVCIDCTTRLRRASCTGSRARGGGG
jgi:hypothetical protein